MKDPRTPPAEPLIRFVDLQAQHRQIRSELDAALSAVIDTGKFVLGPQVEAFEYEFATLCGTAHAIGVDSGTSALRLALRALDVGPGDEVITVSLTFWATVAAILEIGATPVLVDVEATTCNMDVSLVEEAITAKTKALMPVHLYGRCADMDSVNEIASRHGLAVIEDAAQAAGSTYKSRPAGNLGHIACFSFYPAKNLGALGDGGAVVTNDAAVAQRIRMLRDHGTRQKYVHEVLGYNGRLDEIQAAALRVKLPHLNEWNARRRQAAAWYRTLLPRFEVPPDDGGQNHHLFPIQSTDQHALRGYLNRFGIETGIHYPIPAHLQPAYLNAGLTPVSLPRTERICSRTVSLPMHPYLEQRQVKQVADAISEFERLPRPIGRRAG